MTYDAVTGIRSKNATVRTGSSNSTDNRAYSSWLDMHIQYVKSYEKMKSSCIAA
jgi:hypothetical protein